MMKTWRKKKIYRMGFVYHQKFILIRPENFQDQVAAKQFSIQMLYLAKKVKREILMMLFKADVLM